MRAHTVTFSTIHLVGPLWAEYFKLRKEEFVDLRHWDIAHNDEAEWDAYDCPNARWIIIEDEGRCVGGARIMATNACSIEPYSYMIRDFQRGVIHGIPVEKLPSILPISPAVFEATRFFVRRDLGLKKTIKVQREVVNEICRATAALGGKQIMAVMPQKIYSIFRKMGFSITEHSESFSFEGQPYCVGFLNAIALAKAA